MVVVLSIRLVFESLACKEGILVGFSAKKILEHFRGVLKKKEEIQKKSPEERRKGRGNADTREHEGVPFLPP